MIAAYDLVGSLVTEEPSLAGDVLFGARALAHLEHRLALHLIDSWREGRSSLRNWAALRPTG